MRKTDQTVCEPVKGDCMGACIASILECDLDRLPNPDNGGFWEWQNFLKDHGLRLLGKGSSLYYWDSYWIGIVPSLNNEGRLHAVVMYGAKLAHDPNIATRYEELDYTDCVEGYAIVFSDAGLYRGSSLYA